MIEDIAEKLFDPRFMGTLLTAVAAAATAYAVAQPFLPGRRGDLDVQDRKSVV